MDEIPHRAIVDLEPAPGEFRHQPAQREGSLPNALGQKGRVPVADRLRLVSAHLARRHAARLVKPPHPVDDRADPNAELSRRSMARKSAVQNRCRPPAHEDRSNKAFPSMLASFQPHPESEISDLGNPVDSIRIHRALVPTGGRRSRSERFRDQRPDLLVDRVARVHRRGRFGVVDRRDDRRLARRPDDRDRVGRSVLAAAGLVADAP